MQNYQNYQVKELKYQFIGINKIIDNTIVEIAANNGKKYIRELLDSSYQGVKDCLFLLMIIQQVIIKFLLILSKNTFFQDLKLKIDGRNFYDQPINDSIKQYDEEQK